jgi:predicted nuclease with TOPRIM domain
MGELVDSLGNKAAGQLIKSEDWNALVAAVENLSESVDQRFEEVDGQLQNLSDRVEVLSTDFTEFRGQVEPLLGEYYRLTLQTTGTSFAIGELAEITAQVTDLRGNALDLSNDADRPWIDFVVASWGQLRPVAGFESLGGAGDRTISVRTDAEGVARVQLRSDHAEGFTDEDEAEVAVSLQTTLPTTNLSIAETILSAATPLEAKGLGAFQVLTTEYDRTDALRVRNYADAYYLKNTALITGDIVPPFTHSWLDYRSTLMAFARRDSDPITPDQSRGVSSIQVTFRDWIFPWILTDYFVETGPLVQDFRDHLGPKIVDNLDESVFNIKAEVSDFVLNKGLLGRQRNYLVIQDALDTVTTPQPVAYDLNKLTGPMQDAVGIQRTLESAQGVASGFADRELAFGLLTDTAVRADQAAESGKQLTDHVDEQLVQAKDDLLFQVQQEQASFSDELLRVGGPIQEVRERLQTVSGEVQGFQQALNAKADVQTLARFLPN